MQPLIKANEALKIEGFHNIYYFEFDKNHSHPVEKHGFWEMVYVDMGSIVAVGENENVNLCEGQVIFREPLEPHAHISNSKNANNLLVVSFSCESKCMEFFKTNKIFTLDKTAKTLLSLFANEAALALGKIPYYYHDISPLDFSGEKFGASQLMENHFTEFLIKLMRGNSNPENVGVPAAKTGEFSKAEMITEYLESHIYDKITLNELCGKFFLQKSQISAIFKAHTGKSPMKYFGALKIEEAKKLLRDDELSVSEISYKLKFSDIYSFSRAFKLATGFSPTEYKKSISHYVE